MLPQRQIEEDEEVNSSQYIMTEDEKEIIRLQLDVSSELKNFEFEVLRGMMEIQDSKGNKKWVNIAPGEKPNMNELGIREILGRIKSKVTKMGKLTCKSDTEIFMDMFQYDMSITELIAKRSDIWDMDLEIAKSIKDSAVDIVWDIAASSRDGFTAINLRSQYSKSEVTRGEQKQPEKRKFLGIPIGGTR